MIYSVFTYYESPSLSHELQNTGELIHFSCVFLALYFRTLLHIFHYDKVPKSYWDCISNLITSEGKINKCILIVDSVHSTILMRESRESSWITMRKISENVLQIVTWTLMKVRSSSLFVVICISVITAYCFFLFS